MVKPDLQTGLRAMGNSVRWFADQLAAVLMVSRCAACKEVVLHARRLPICSACLEKFPSLNEPLCQRCGRPLATPAGRPPQCFACRRGAYAFDRARSCAPYLEPAVTMIELLKRHPIRPLAAWLTGHMQGVLQQVPEFGAVDALVPVPLDRRRRKKRGFNQAELLARALGRRMRIPVRADVLVRVRPRPDELLLSRRQRWESTRGAFAVPEGVRVDKMRILLLDDVLTTGATLDACARALKQAGAGAVYALTVARTVPTETG
jgi:ComF family protein